MMIDYTDEEANQSQMKKLIKVRWRS